MKEAPLFIQCQALARWMLQNFEAHPALMDSVQRGSLRLLDDVVLALKDFDRDERLRSADATAALLHHGRAHAPEMRSRKRQRAGI